VKKIFIFYYEFRNTSGNHCGMAYFARKLKQNIGLDVKLIRIPQNYAKFREILKKIWRRATIKLTARKSRPEDVFFFMEYINPSQVPGDHCTIVEEMRRQGIQNKMVGLVHLPPQILVDTLGEEYIKNAAERIDRILVMGSNLTEMFTRMGFKEKVVWTFHYVDTGYYRPVREEQKHDKFTVFCSGYLFRNPEKLKEIISRCPDVTFDLCMGMKDLKSLFGQIPNVILNGFLKEEEMLRYMQKAHVSLSVFDDMVASNVILTSLSCGLPQVVSDEGAVRDYCSEENTVFCKTVEDFIEAIYSIKKDPDKRLRMGHHARIQAEKISMENSIRWYRDFFELI